MPPYPGQSYDSGADSRPAYLDYDSSKPIPPGYRLESSARKGMVIPGLIIFGISYLVAAAVASETSQTDTSYSYSGSSVSTSNTVPFNNKLLYVPVLGPWLAIGTLDTYDCPSTGYSSYYSDCQDKKDEAAAWGVLLLVGGVTQALGATLAIIGFSARSRYLVRTDSLRAQLVPTPMGHGGQGLTLVGEFGGL